MWRRAQTRAPMMWSENVALYGGLYEVESAGFLSSLSFSLLTQAATFLVDSITKGYFYNYSIDLKHMETTRSGKTGHKVLVRKDTEQFMLNEQLF